MVRKRKRETNFWDFLSEQLEKQNEYAKKPITKTELKNLAIVFLLLMAAIIIMLFLGVLFELFERYVSSVTCFMTNYSNIVKL